MRHKAHSHTTPNQKYLIKQRPNKTPNQTKNIITHTQSNKKPKQQLPNQKKGSNQTKNLILKTFKHI